MFYPNHPCRSYCLYLGSLELDGHKYDLGVYEHKDSVSHAIVYGDDPSEYISGEFIFKDREVADFSNLLAKINKMVYMERRKSE